MPDYAENIARKLQAFKENELSESIIIPLLERMGYHNVEFYGGKNEHGRDIIFWDKNRMGDIRLFVAQVKHFRMTNRAAGTQSFQTIVNQLHQCHIRALPYTDKSIHFPAEVFLISSYPIDTETLQTRFDQAAVLKDQPVQIIDGIKLASLILKHMPEITKELLGVDMEIVSKIQRTINTKILLTALGHNREKNIKAIYMDINFSLGNRSTRLFSNLDGKPTVEKISLDEADLELLKKIISSVKAEYSLRFFNKDLELITRDAIKKRQAELDREILPLTAIVENKRKETYELHKIYYTKSAEFVEFKSTFVQNDEMVNRRTLLNHQIDRLKEEHASAMDEHQKLKQKLENLENEKSFAAGIECDGNILIGEILEKRSWIQSEIEKFNKKKSGGDELKHFLLKCRSITEKTAVFFNHPEFFSCIGLKESSLIRENFETTRLELSIEDAFDTGLNFAVFGEAGAGKTTTLQMYFDSRKDISEKLVIWLSLGQLIQNKIFDKSFDPDTDFEACIYNHLTQIGANITYEEFIITLNTKKTVFLFDGIDEAIKPAPWVPQAIKAISLRYVKNMQVVVSSRESSSYVDSIPFYPITLLPFTERQRDTFITKWFEDEDDKEAVSKIIPHLEKNKAMAEITKNPLLATTLCVIAKYKITLPSTEVKLYEERIKLLTGQYDKVKNILPRISVPPHILEIVAQKLAFFLHSHVKSEEYPEVIKARINEIIHNGLDEDQARIALNELDDPCNILVPMTGDGKFGFFHLRYQEHLAAKELMTNRAINIIPLLRNAWWRGALTLFAAMNDDLDWLIRQLRYEEISTDNELTIKEMIAVRPVDEQRNYKHLEATFIANRQWRP